MTILFRPADVPRQRISQESLNMWLKYLHSKDPFTLKFFDEAGLKLPRDNTRCYGHAPKGQRCVEVRRYHETPNITIKVLAGLQGVKYANIVDGASTTIHFLEFWGEAANAGDVITGRPALEVGDVVVMDNCATHHFDRGVNLVSFFDELGIELVYTPAYYPDFNPVEFVFSKMRTEMHYRLIDLVESNLKLGAYEALDSINANDMKGFYLATSYIDI